MSEARDNRRIIELSVAAAVAAAMALLIVFVTQQAQQLRAASVSEIAYLPIAVFPDFASVPDVEVKKQQFFDFFQDYVFEENENIRSLREELLPFAAITRKGWMLSTPEHIRLLEIAATYKMEQTLSNEAEVVEELLQRVDIIPTSLALAQAATESAWGTSRFALEGNNVFGQWCYEKDCGIVPSRRPSGAVHEVEIFPSIKASVQAYFTNINTNDDYQFLRDQRAQMRAQGRKLDSMILAFGLGRYSERGDSYVDEVQTLIVQNDLLKRDKS
ncbi:MAG: glucosaminidase domain-containing protein [Gammaproteobacteria bacterium]|jgi:Bax protein|nr:glucosaminidase [Gammaproteobacteria bacterium]MDP6097625.1 glucosaminidase domain-containing protein [Gammaproteobacteria bacterium]MDP7455178.1 glucosaminidase domain-containing protein [Gammaproteobacteria bacterium]HJO10486.1 glucosaminidase domain-containing protein [Gammaproteobacteria bacterium]